MREHNNSGDSFEYKHNSNLDDDLNSLNMSSTLWNNKLQAKNFQQTQAGTNSSSTQTAYTFRKKEVDNPYSNYEQYKQERDLDNKIAGVESKLDTSLADLNNKDDFYKQINNEEVLPTAEPKQESPTTNEKNKEIETERLTAAQMLASGIASAIKRRGDRNAIVAPTNLIDKSAIKHATEQHQKSKDINGLCDEAKNHIDNIALSNDSKQIKKSIKSLDDDLKTINMTMKNNLAKSEFLQGKDLGKHLETVANDKKKVENLIRHGKDNEQVVGAKSKATGSEFNLKDSMDNLKESMRKIMDSIKEITQKFMPANIGMKP